MTIYETHPDLVAEFDSVKDELDDADDRKPALGLAKRLVRLAEQLVDAAPDDPDANQILGLAWYHFPLQSSWRSWHCRAALEKALHLDPSHPWARKYLGYLLVDQECYEEALQHFKNINHEAFDQPDREWELLKIRELCLVCQLRVASTVLPDDFTSFCATFHDARTREDRAIELGSTVPLLELPQCAEWLLERGGDSNSTSLREILKFLSGYRSEVSFWNPAFASILTSALEDAVEQRFVD